MDTVTIKVVIALLAQSVRKNENQKVDFFHFSRHQQEEHWNTMK